MKRVSFYTFGCRLNQSETAVIQNSLESKGYSVVDFEQSSDIVVVNTCTVTENGDADTRRLVHKINRTHPQAKIALVGCQAQVQKEALADLPNVSWVVGNQRKMHLADVLNEYPTPLKAEVITPTIERAAFTQSELALDRDHTRATLKIQDGCDFFCSFCEIPYARGRARSRVFEDIMREANDLVHLGKKEFVLTGINIGTYNYQGRGLMDVIDALSDIDGVYRIRLSSIEPTTVPATLFDRMNDKLCRYLHLPLQAGDDAILSAMKRKYTMAEYEDFIRDVKNRIPQLCIGTDIIVGFPGETDAHFENTLNAVRDLPIDYVHVFSYSPRHMAQSRKADEVINPAIIAKRSSALRDLSARKKMMFHQHLLGTTQEVLLESIKDGYWMGLTDHYVRVKIGARETMSKNSILTVRLTGIDSTDMIGECTHG